MHYTNLVPDLSNHDLPVDLYMILCFITGSRGARGLTYSPDVAWGRFSAVSVAGPAITNIPGWPPDWPLCAASFCTRWRLFCACFSLGISSLTPGY